MGIELSQINLNRKSFIELGFPNEEGEEKVEKLEFEYIPLSPVILKKLDKITVEVNKSNKENEENEEYVPRSALLEQLCILLKKIDILENGIPIEITIENLEKVTLEILNQINLKIYEERILKKPISTTLSDTTQEVVG